MGCYQPMLTCIEMGWPTRSLNRSQLLNEISFIKNSLIIIFKFKPSQQEVDALNNNNNIVIRYVGDGQLSREIEYHKTVTNFDGLILGSHDFKKIVDGDKNINTQTVVIPANHDMFLDGERFKNKRNKKFSLFFGGSTDPTGIKTQGELGLSGKYSEGYFHSLFYMYETMKGKKECDLRNYLLNIRKCPHLNSIIESSNNPSLYSCHYGVRSPYYFDISGNRKKIKYEQWVTKTGGKVSTAAASGANIITSLDPSVRVLIDENYPYAIDTEKLDFLDNHEEICSQMIEKVKSTFNTKTWFEGLNILNKVRERTTTKRITTDYVKFGIHLYDLLR